MTPEERQLLEGLFERIKTAAPNAPDKEAEEFIGKSMKDMPHAGYVLSQAVIVQEEALKAAAAKIEELEGQVQELDERVQKAEANSGGFLGGIGKSLFGGNEPAPRQSADRQGYDDRQGYGDQQGYDNRRSAVPSSRAPNSGISVPPRPGAEDTSPWNRSNGPGMAAGQQAGSGGNSFLKGALGAAAGVAGGMLLANAVSGLFTGHNNPLGISNAKAAEGKSADASSSSGGDDWGDSKASDSTEGDDWKEDNNNSGDDWDNSNDSNDDWDDEGGDWDDGDDGGDWD